MFSTTLTHEGNKRGQLPKNGRNGQLQQKLGHRWSFNLKFYVRTVFRKFCLVMLCYVSIIVVSYLELGQDY